MQAKLQELEKASTEQAKQVSSLREELQGSLAELDQVHATYSTPIFQNPSTPHTLG